MNRAEPVNIGHRFFPDLCDDHDSSLCQYCGEFERDHALGRRIDGKDQAQMWNIHY